MPVTRAKKKSLLPEGLVSADESCDMDYPRRVTRSYAHIKPINEIEDEGEHRQKRKSNKRDSASGIFTITDETSTEIMTNELVTNLGVDNCMEPPKKKSGRSKRTTCAGNKSLSQAVNCNKIPVEKSRKSKRLKRCSALTLVDDKLHNVQDSFVEPDSTVTFPDDAKDDNTDQNVPQEEPKIIEFDKSLPANSLLPKNNINEIYSKTPMKRESTYIIEKETHPNYENNADCSISKSNKSKHVFGAAIPTKTFGDNKKIKTDFLTPAKTLCRFISVGSAGQTPIPIKDKIKNSTDYVPVAPNATPKRKSPFLNLTHSIEKPESVQSEAIFPINLMTQPNNSTISKKPLTFGNAFNGKKVDFKNKSKLPISKLPNRPLNKGRPIVDDKKKSRGISKATKKPVIAFSNAKAKQILKIIQTDGVPTPKQIVKPVIPSSRKNMPNFHSVHQKQFERMESLLQNKMRKEERAKKLMSYTPRSKDTATKLKFMNENRSDPPKFTKFGFKLNLDGYKILPKVDYEDSPNTKTTIQSRVKEQSISSSLADPPTNKSRTENRNFLVGVRTNRRFELQMKVRNAK